MSNNTKKLSPLEFERLLYDRRLILLRAVLGRELTNLGLVLTTLLPREKKVLEIRFGLVDGKPQTLEQVGRVFRVTRERIRQIEAKALRKMRHPSRLALIFNEHKYKPIAGNQDIYNYFDTLTANALWRAGYKTMNKVAKLSYDDLRKIPYVGIKRAELIKLLIERLPY